MTRDEKTVFVTGGTSGIGRSLVEIYTQRGWRVLTCGRSVSSLARLEREIPGTLALPCDLSSADERAALASQVYQRVGRLDGLINNAGVQCSRVYPDIPSGELEFEVATNLVAPLDLAHRLASLLSSPEAFVANVSSGLAYVPLGRSPIYCATKAGLSHYTRSLREQGGGPRFVEIVLPMVDTPMTAGRGKGKISPLDAATQIVSGIERGRETVWVGKSRFLPLLTRVAPALLRRMLNRQAAGSIDHGS